MSTAARLTFPFFEMYGSKTPEQTFYNRNAWWFSSKASTSTTNFVNENRPGSPPVSSSGASTGAPASSPKKSDDAFACIGAMLALGAKPEGAK